MTFTQVVSQCIQTIQASPKGVHAVVQLRNGNLIAACGDCTVTLYCMEAGSGEYALKSTIKIKNVPHTIGYDTKREQVYVGCAWGTVEQISIKEDSLENIYTHKWSSREISHVTYRMDADVVMSTGFDGMFLVYDPVQNVIITHCKLCDDPIRYIRYDDVGGKLYLGTHKPGIPVFKMEEPEKGDKPESQYVLGLQERTNFFHKDPVRCILLDPHSRYMFSCDHQGKILVWHAGQAGKEVEKPALGELDGHLNSKLRALCWLHDPKALLSAGENGRILVHNVGQKKTCGSWQAHQDELMGIDEIRFTEGYNVMSWAKDGKVCIWRLTFRIE